MEELDLRRGGSDRIRIDTQQRTRRTEDANAFHDDVSVEEFPKGFDRLFTLPQRRHDLARANVELENSLACAHDIKAASHADASGRRSDRIKLGGSDHDIGVDLSAPLDDGVGHGDPIDSATEHALVGSDSTEHSRIEAIAFRTPDCDVVQCRAKQLECRFLRLRAVVPEKPLLKELRGNASKGRYFEAKQRRTVLPGVADETDFRCCL
jgi:hypothetical protein